MISTFNGVTLTNGYHPLWMLICSIIFALGATKLLALHIIACLIIILNIATIAIVSHLLSRLGFRYWHFSGAILIPFLFATQLGSEGAISALFLSCLILSAVNMVELFSPRRFVWFNVIAALAMLSRLDNVFVVSFVVFSVVIYLIRNKRLTELLPAMAYSVIIYVCLLGSYIATNIWYFGSPIPISGLIKASQSDPHAFGANIGNIGKASIVLICLSFAIDRWFLRSPYGRFVLAPFGLGVLVHAAYIGFVMSNETRWAWYYTSWVILASIVVGIGVNNIIAKLGCGIGLFKRFEPKILGASLMVASVLPFIWAWPALEDKLQKSESLWIGAMERALTGVIGDGHPVRLMTFDYPGKIAYFSSMQVVAVDGLTCDLEFQRELASNGINAYLSKHNINIFLGPQIPISEGGYDKLCRRLFSGSTKFTCSKEIDGGIYPVKVDVFSRVPPKNVGFVNLKQENVIWAGEMTAYAIR